MEYKKVPKLDFNTNLFWSELKKAGIQLQKFEDPSLILASKGKHKELLYDLANSRSSYTSSWIASDKFLTKKVLQQHNIPVAKGEVFHIVQVKEAMKYAENIGFPVVIKPVTDGQGNFVYSQIDTAEELQQRIDFFAKEYLGKPYFILEKHIPGEEYRIFISESGFLAAVHREPAAVKGDGTHSLIQLIQIENYQRLNPRTTCLCEIKLDDVLFDYLDKHQLSLDYVPKKSEVVELRPNSNVSKGGNCIDVTEKVHSSVRKLAKQVLAAMGNLAFVGLDLICADISKPLRNQTHVICELNPFPGLSLHSLPAVGKSRNVAAEVAQLVFPEAKKK
jgi:cyanophycin synthetase